MPEATQTQDTTDSDTESSAKRYDHDAIMADLESGMATKEIVEKYGCSYSLVANVRRKMENGGKRPTANQVRADKHRKRASQFTQDFDLLAKWAERDTEDKQVAALIEKLEGVVEGLTEAADMYDALPDAVTTAPVKPRRVPLEAGMVVKVKERALKNWKGVTADPSHLKVLSVRETHALVEDTDGARALIPRKDLEVRQDG